MSDHGYDDGPTRGGKWGCAVAAIVGAPIFFFLMLVDALVIALPTPHAGRGFGHTSQYQRRLSPLRLAWAFVG